MKYNRIILLLLITIVFCCSCTKVTVAHEGKIIFVKFIDSQKGYTPHYEIQFENSPIVKIRNPKVIPIIGEYFRLVHIDDGLGYSRYDLRMIK